MGLAISAGGDGVTLSQGHGAPGDRRLILVFFWGEGKQATTLRGTGWVLYPGTGG